MFRDLSGLNSLTLFSGCPLQSAHPLEVSASQLHPTPRLREGNVNSRKRSLCERMDPVSVAGRHQEASALLLRTLPITHTQAKASFLI